MWKTKEKNQLLFKDKMFHTSNKILFYATNYHEFNY
jgi:hypothetical protein